LQLTGDLKHWKKKMKEDNSQEAKGIREGERERRGERKANRRPLSKYNEVKPARERITGSGGLA